MKAIFVALGMLLFAVTACKKDKASDPPPEVTAMDLITKAAWWIDTIAVDSDEDGEIDTPLPVVLQPCDYDNILIFYTDSTASFQYGPLKCNQSEPDNVPLTWYFKQNNEVVNITGEIPNLQGDVDILSLSETSLVLSKSVIGITGKMIVSLRH